MPARQVSPRGSKAAEVLCAFDAAPELPTRQCSDRKAIMRTGQPNGRETAQPKYRRGSAGLEPGSVMTVHRRLESVRI